MINRFFSVTAVLVVLVSASFSMAQQEAAERPGIVLGDSIVITATVQALNKADRTVVLRSSDGSVHEVEVDQAVKNYDQIEIGDEVKVEFYQALALSLGVPGEPMTEGTQSILEVAQPGDKPNLTGVEVVDVIATVSAIDKEARTATLIGPLGNSVTIQADDSMKNFDKVKVGDKVQARYIEAIAISVTKPE